jgi:hypothetical protein
MFCLVALQYAPAARESLFRQLNPCSGVGNSLFRRARESVRKPLARLCNLASADARMGRNRGISVLISLLVGKFAVARSLPTSPLTPPAMRALP